jgi:hypothetical protein
MPQTSTATWRPAPSLRQDSKLVPDIAVATTRYAIVPDGDQPRALVIPGENGWTLPSCHSEERLSSLDEFNQALREAFGLDVIVLRDACPPESTLDGDERLFLWMESRSPVMLPPGARWVEETEIPALPGLDSRQASALEAWFADFRSPPEPYRSPWAHRKWIDEATAWIRENLIRSGYGEQYRVSQLRSWSITQILRVETMKGTVYFKASHPMFPQESGLTRYLDEQYPAAVPTVIAADEARNWFLMESFAGPMLRETTDPGPWEASLRLFARMQIECIDRRDDLSALGCPTRPLEPLAAGLRAVLEDEPALNLGYDFHIAQEEIEALLDLQPRIEEALEELVSFNLPTTLLHGDLHPDNIVITESGPLFYDWSDGAVAHPFFELLTAPGTLREIDSRPEAAARYRRIYLEAWRDFGSGERLEEAFALSQKLLPCYHALSYYWIIQNTEPTARWELGGGLSYFLSRLLQAFQDGAGED